MKRLIIAILLLTACLAGCKPSSYTETDIPESIPTSMPTKPAAASTLPTSPPETQPPVITQPEPKDEDFVQIRDYIPDLAAELPYATTDNFTGQVIYDFSEPWLRYGTVKKLLQAQELLKAQGFQLMVWDSFRPTAAQFKLWDICPDPVYVSNPHNGFSSHSRGNTVDVTLLDSDGQPVAMPTGYDDFSALADRDYSDCAPEAAENARLLEQVMTACGFKGYYSEWWHYTDTQAYPVDEEFLPIEASIYRADCEEFISLRTAPDTAAEVITRITVGEKFMVVAFQGSFALVRYRGALGYVLKSYIQPID